MKRPVLPRSTRNCKQVKHAEHHPITYTSHRVVAAGHEDIARTLIYTGRPLRVFKTPYVADWEENRREEIKTLTSKGIIPNEHEMEKHPEKSLQARYVFVVTEVRCIYSSILRIKHLPYG